MLIGTRRSLLQTPSPLFVDTFSRANGGLGSGWTGATWTIASKKAVNTPTQGSDLLVAKNGNFADWTLDDPDDWTVVGESGADPEVAEVATGEAHADAGTPGGGFCNIYNSAVLVYIHQAILTAGKFYHLTTNVDTVTAGAIVASNIAGQNYADQWNSTGSKFATFQAITNTTFAIQRNTNPTDITFDDVTVKELTLSTLFSTFPCSTSEVSAVVDLTLTASTQAGLVLCLDDAATPANFILAEIDLGSTNRLLLQKCVAGTYTILINTAITYAANATLKVVKNGTSVSAYYNDAQVGTTQTVSDAGVINNKTHGLFSTYASNTMDNFILKKS